MVEKKPKKLIYYVLKFGYFKSIYFCIYDVKNDVFRTEFWTLYFVLIGGDLTDEILRLLEMHLRVSLAVLKVKLKSLSLQCAISFVIYLSTLRFHIEF